MTNITSSLPDPNSYGSIGWVLVILVAIITGLNQAMKFLAHFQEKPSPPETYATKEACAVTHAALDQRLKTFESEIAGIRDEVHEMGIRLDKTSEDRSIATHTRLNGLEGLCNKIDGKLETLMKKK